MTSILVVCTGNVCRSPIAEGFLRAALERRFGDLAPDVSSAGTSGWEGSAAMAGSVEAARELGVDIAGHRGRRLTMEMARASDLLLCMAQEHLEALERADHDLAPRAFTLKELVRLLDALPPAPPEALPEGLRARLEEADRVRTQGSLPGSRDTDIADPLGQPLEAFRAIAWEIDTWVERLVHDLFGPVAGAVAEGA